MTLPLDTIRNITRFNRSAEFPGQLQALPCHNTVLEQLAVGILAHVQAQDTDPAQRRSQFCAQFTSRLIGRDLDPTLVNPVVACAESLDLFAD